MRSNEQPNLYFTPPGGLVVAPMDLSEWMSMSSMFQEETPYANHRLAAPTTPFANPHGAIAALANSKSNSVHMGNNSTSLASAAANVNLSRASSSSAKQHAGRPHSQLPASRSSSCAARGDGPWAHRRGGGLDGKDSVDVMRSGPWGSRRSVQEPPKVPCSGNAALDRYLASFLATCIERQDNAAAVAGTRTSSLGKVTMLPGLGDFSTPCRERGHSSNPSSTRTSMEVATSPFQFPNPSFPPQLPPSALVPDLLSTQSITTQLDRDAGSCPFVSPAMEAESTFQFQGRCHETRDLKAVPRTEPVGAVFSSTTSGPLPYFPSGGSLTLGEAAAAAAAAELAASSKILPVEGQMLYVSETYLDELQCASILALLQVAHEEIHAVSLSKCSLTDEGLQVLVPGLARCTKLVYLDLSKNTITEDGAVLLASILPRLHDLAELHLSCNRIGPDGLTSILAAVRRCPQLRKLTAKHQSQASKGAGLIALPHFPVAMLPALYDNPATPVGFGGAADVGPLPTMSPFEGPGTSGNGGGEVQKEEMTQEAASEAAPNEEDEDRSAASATVDSMPHGGAGGAGSGCSSIATQVNHPYGVGASGQSEATSQSNYGTWNSAKRHLPSPYAISFPDPTDMQTSSVEAVGFGAGNAGSRRRGKDSATGAVGAVDTKHARHNGSKFEKEGSDSVPMFGEALEMCGSLGLPPTERPAANSSANGALPRYANLNADIAAVAAALEDATFTGMTSAAAISGLLTPQAPAALAFDSKRSQLCEEQVVRVVSLLSQPATVAEKAVAKSILDVSQSRCASWGTLLGGGNRRQTIILPSQLSKHSTATSDTCAEAWSASAIADTTLTTTMTEVSPSASCNVAPTTGEQVLMTDAVLFDAATTALRTSSDPTNTGDGQSHSADSNNLLVTCSSSSLLSGGSAGVQEALRSKICLKTLASSLKLSGISTKIVSTAGGSNVSLCLKNLRHEFLLASPPAHPSAAIGGVCGFMQPFCSTLTSPLSTCSSMRDQVLMSGQAPFNANASGRLGSDAPSYSAAYPLSLVSVSLSPSAVAAVSFSKQRSSSLSEGAASRSAIASSGCGGGAPPEAFGVAHEHNNILTLKVGERGDSDGICGTSPPCPEFRRVGSARKSASAVESVTAAAAAALIQGSCFACPSSPSSPSMVLSPSAMLRVLAVQRRANVSPKSIFSCDDSFTTGDGSGFSGADEVPASISASASSVAEPVGVDAIGQHTSANSTPSSAIIAETEFACGGNEALPNVGHDASLGACIRDEQEAATASAASVGCGDVGRSIAGHCPPPPDLAGGTQLEALTGPAVVGNEVGKLPSNSQSGQLSLRTSDSSGGCASGGSFSSFPFPPSAMDDNRKFVIVDPSLQEQFLLAQPTPRYAKLIAALPRIYIGEPERLRVLVKFMCKEMQLAFKMQGRSIPPWRRASSMYSKWRLQTSGYDSAFKMPPSSPGGGSAPSFSGNTIPLSQVATGGRVGSGGRMSPLGQASVHRQLNYIAAGGAIGPAAAMAVAATDRVVDPMGVVGDQGRPSSTQASLFVGAANAPAKIQTNEFGCSLKYRVKEPSKSRMRSARDEDLLYSGEFVREVPIYALALSRHASEDLVLATVAPTSGKPATVSPGAASGGLRARLVSGGDASISKGSGLDVSAAAIATAEPTPTLARASAAATDSEALSTPTPRDTDGRDRRRKSGSGAPMSCSDGGAASGGGYSVRQAHLRVLRGATDVVVANGSPEGSCPQLGESECPSTSSSPLAATRYIPSLPAEATGSSPSGPVEPRFNGLGPSSVVRRPRAAPVGNSRSEGGGGSHHPRAKEAAVASLAIWSAGEGPPGEADRGGEESLTFSVLTPPLVLSRNNKKRGGGGGSGNATLSRRSSPPSSGAMTGGVTVNKGVLSYHFARSTCRLEENSSNVGATSASVVGRELTAAQGAPSERQTTGLRGEGAVRRAGGEVFLTASYEGAPAAVGWSESRSEYAVKYAEGRAVDDSSKTKLQEGLSCHDDAVGTAYDPLTADPLTFMDLAFRNGWAATPYAFQGSAASSAAVSCRDWTVDREGSVLHNGQQQGSRCGAVAAAKLRPSLTSDGLVQGPPGAISLDDYLSTFGSAGGGGGGGSHASDRQAPLGEKESKRPQGHSFHAAASRAPPQDGARRCNNGASGERSFTAEEVCFRANSGTAAHMVRQREARAREEAQQQARPCDFLFSRLQALLPQVLRMGWQV